MTHTILKDQIRPQDGPGFARALRTLRIRSDVYGWVIVPHRPSETGQTVHVCGVADVRPSIQRCSWMLRRTESITDALRQLAWIRNEQACIFSAHFTDAGVEMVSVCTRRGEGVGTYIPGSHDVRGLVSEGAWMAARPLSSHLGFCPYDEPSILLLDRRENMDSFCVGTSSGTVETAWYQMGWKPSLLATELQPMARGTITADTSWQIRSLDSGRAQWLLDQSGDQVPDLSYFLRKHPEWFRTTDEATP